MHQNKQAAPRYSIIIPAFEEEMYIASTLQALRIYLENEKWLATTEVIVVSASGNDATAKIARAHANLFANLTVIEPGPKEGKGRDVKAGMLAATGSFRLFMDADMATPLHHLRPAFEALESGANIVIGVRELRKVHKKMKRKLVSIVGNRLIYAVLGLRYGDSQCGFKGFDASSAELLFSRQTIKGWGFDIELLVIARQHSLSVAEIKVPDWSDPKNESDLVGESTGKAAARTFKDLWAIRRHWKQGDYT